MNFFSAKRCVSGAAITVPSQRVRHCQSLAPSRPPLALPPLVPSQKPQGLSPPLDPQDLLTPGTPGFALLVRASARFTSASARPLSLRRFLPHSCAASGAPSCAGRDTCATLKPSCGLKRQSCQSLRSELLTRLTLVAKRRHWGCCPCIPHPRGRCTPSADQSGMAAPVWGGS